jgi:hypothetical protein
MLSHAKQCAAAESAYLAGIVREAERQQRAESIRRKLAAKRN